MISKRIFVKLVRLCTEANYGLDGLQNENVCSLSLPYFLSLSSYFSLTLTLTHTLLFFIPYLVTVQRKSLRDIPSFSSSKVSSQFFLYVCFIVHFSICRSSNTFFFYLEQKFQVCGPLVSYRVEYDACDTTY